MNVANFQTILIDQLLTLDTAAYASGDSLFDKIALTLAAKDPTIPRRGRVRSITVIDTDAQKGQFDLVFFDSDPTTIGAANAVVSLSDANAAKVIGLVNVTSYTDLKATDNAVAVPSFDPIEFVLAPANPVTLYVAGISRDAKTYTANGLRLRMAIEIDNIEQL